jgi:chromosome segregation ATPase
VDSSAVSARLIGSVFVEKGLITEEQLEDALELQRTTGERLGEILVERFKIERLELAGALAEQWAEYERSGANDESEPLLSPTPLATATPRDPNPAAATGAATKRPIGEIFVERGLVTAVQLEEALEEQKKSGRRLGEVLVATGKLSRLELASALADQWATFQKLRPPDAPPEADAPEAAAAKIMPTPEAILPPPGAGPTGAAFELATRIDALSARVDELAAAPPATAIGNGTELVEAAAALAARVDQLEAAPTVQPDHRVDELRARLDDVVARLDAQPSAGDDWRLELAQLADDLRTRVERVEQDVDGAATGADAQIAEIRSSLASLADRIDSPPQPSDDWREAVTDLAGRIEAQSARTGDWQEPLTAIAERVESLSNRSDDWRSELADFAARLDAVHDESSAAGRDLFDALAERIQSVEHGLEGQAWAAAVAELAGQLQALAARIDALPVPSEEWRGEVAELRSRLESLPAPSEEWRDDVRALRERLESLPVPSEEWRGEVAELRSRLESLPAPSEEWREQLADIRARLDGLPVPSEEWRGEIAELRSRLESLPVPSEGWRGEVAELRSRLDSSPAPSEEWRELISALAARVDGLVTDGWRGAQAELVEQLGSRLDRIESAPPAVSADEVAAIRGAVEQLRAQVDSLGAPHEALWADRTAHTSDLSDRVRRLEESLSGAVTTEALEALVGERSDELRAGTAHLSERIDHAFGRLDELSSATGADSAGMADRLAELHDIVGRHAGELESLAARAEQFRSRDVEERLVERLAAVEGSLAEAHSALGASEPLADRIGAVEERASAISMHSAQEIELLRRQLGELHAAQAGLDTSVSARIGDVEGTLRGELKAVTDRAAHDADLQALSVAMSEGGAQAEALGQKLLRLERRLDETGAARGADLAAMRARLENVETRLTGEVAAAEAIAEAKERVERFEGLLQDAAGIEAAARRAQIEQLRAELGDRVAAVESAQAGRKDVRELARGLRRVERRLDARDSVDEASTRAIEKTVRKGLSKLGEQITDAEDSYLEAGRKLHSAIESLGRAVHAADDHLEQAGERGGDNAAGATYVAFAPTLEGYRLVVCSGSAPELGERVVVPSCEGELVVSRVGMSPLPFDARACVYLEQA